MAYNFSQKPKKGKYKKTDYYQKPRKVKQNYSNPTVIKVEQPKQVNQTKVKIPGWIILLTVIVIAVIFLSFFSRTITLHVKDQIPVDFVESIDNLTPEQIEYYENRLMFTTNYYANEDDSGIMLREMKIDYFVDSDLTMENAKSVVMQYTGTDINKHIVSSTAFNDTDYVCHYNPQKVIYYYDTTDTNGDVVSWASGGVGTQLTRGASLIFKIDGKPYLFKLTGKEPVFNLFGWKPLYNYYQYGAIFKELMKATKNNTNGGTCYLTLNLSKYFTVKEYVKTVNGTSTWEKTDIAKELLLDAVVKVNYFERGAQTASDSFSGMINNDKDFDIRPITVNYHSNDNQNLLYTETYNYKTTNVELNYNKFVSNGMAISGWKTQPDDSGATYELGQSLNVEPGQVIDIYAKWYLPEYTFYFIGPNNEIESQTFTSGQPQVINDFEFAKDGQYFDYYTFCNDLYFKINVGKELTITLLSYDKYGSDKVKLISGDLETIVSYDKSLDMDEYYLIYSFIPNWQSKDNWTGTYTIKQVNSNDNNLNYSNEDYIIIQDKNIIEICFNGQVYKEFLEMHSTTYGIDCASEDYSKTFEIIFNDNLITFIVFIDNQFISFEMQKS